MKIAEDRALLAHTEMPDMSGSYDLYISSGLYDRRYPRPNRRTLRKALRRLPDTGRFIDLGAGTGRYTLPLLQQTRAIGVAHDICSVARREMSERLSGFLRDGRLVVRGEDASSLAAVYSGAFDLALLAFGVLGHVAGRNERLRLLGAVRDMLKPEGTLILGLPNARRRFRAEQRRVTHLVRAGKLEPGDVLYSRGRGAEEIPMFYHLFTPAEARRDLSHAGFRIESMEPESLLAEETVVRKPLVSRLDDLACRFVPATCGYGFLIVSSPQDGGSSRT